MSGFQTPDIELVESDKDPNTVISQSAEKNTEIDITTQIVLQVSKTPEEETPTAVTKDVVIQLGSSAAEADCKVTVARDGQVVYTGTVQKGTESITLKDQTGLGNVYYEVVINDQDGWIEKVSF